ncbi:MAG: YggT family protein [Alphaproteobacteria bacterium]|nr:YggT family protein [Alphaproteobacteria bacterium]
MNPFIQLISEVINLYSLVVFAWVILSLLIYFKIVNRGHPLVFRLEDVLNRLVEPALKPIRRILPDLGGVDLSPVILILLLHFLNNALFYYVYRF